MTTSNSAFFQLNRTSLGAVGSWEVRILDHKDLKTVVAVVYEWSDLTIGPTLNQPGEGSITIDQDDPFWSTTLPGGQSALRLLDNEYLYQAFEDNILRFEFFGTNVQEKLVEDDLARTITISGAGAAHALSWACVMPPAFPSTKTEQAPLLEPLYTFKYFWRFPFSWPMMKMWLHLLRVSQRRGVIPWINPRFTDDRDSAGQKWEVVPTVESIAEPANGFRPDNGTNLLDLLNKHSGQDLTDYGLEYLEWHMWPGFKLDVRKSIGSHKETRVAWYEAQIQTLERTRVREDIFNYICTIDVNGQTSLATDAASIKTWNKREQLQGNNKNIVDSNRRQAISNLFLRQSKDEKAQWVVRVPYDEPGRKVFVDYHIGDWIGIWLFNPITKDSTLVPFRVLAIIVNIQSVTPTVELTLMTLMEAQLRDIQKQLTTLLNRPNPDVITNITNTTNTTNITNPVVTNPAFDVGVGGVGGYGRVWIQDTDPSPPARVGDLWYDTSYNADPAWPPPPDILNPPEPPLPIAPVIPPVPRVFGPPAVHFGPPPITFGPPPPTFGPPDPFAGVP